MRVIILYRYIPAWGQPDISLFVTKVETYLRMVGLAFEGRIGDVRKAPKQKLPYVDDQGTLVCDSRDIIAHFEAKLDRPLDQNLTVHERALSVAYRALIEEEAYFYAYYLRWQDEQGWRTYLPIMKQYGAAVGLPSWLTPFVFKSVRKNALKSLWGQGSGRHSRDEIDARLCTAVEALCDQLGKGPYFLGERPRVIDASVYAFLSALRNSPFSCRAQDQVRAHSEAAAYCQRMQATYFAA